MVCYQAWYRGPLRRAKWRMRIMTYPASVNALCNPVQVWPVGLPALALVPWKGGVHDVGHLKRFKKTP